MPFRADIDGEDASDGGTNDYGKDLLERVERIQASHHESNASDDVVLLPVPLATLDAFDALLG